MHVLETRVRQNNSLQCTELLTKRRNKQQQNNNQRCSARCCFHIDKPLPSLESKFESCSPLLAAAECAKSTDCQDNLGLPRFLYKHEAGCNELGWKVSCRMRSLLGLIAILPKRINWLWSSFSDRCLDFAISNTVLFGTREIHEGAIFRIFLRHLQ